MTLDLITAQRVGVVHVAGGTTLGFKALPSATLLPATYVDDATATELDWAGIYPQLSFAQAVAYLPNQFDRGDTHASIVKLTTKRPLVLVVCADPTFTDVAVSSAAKAQLVRDAVQSLAAAGADASITAPLRADVPLLRACGEREIVLCIPDADGLELVVPHALFTQEWFACDELFAFVESKQAPSMVGQVVGQPQLHRSVLLDWSQLTTTLEAQLSEHTSVAIEGAVAAALGASNKVQL